MSQYGLHLIETPNGRWVYVGSVPMALAYVDAQGMPLTDSALIERQMMLPSAYRTIKRRSFKSKHEAVEAGLALGIEVQS